MTSIAIPSGIPHRLHDMIDHLAFKSQAGHSWFSTDLLAKSYSKMSHKNVGVRAVQKKIKELVDRNIIMTVRRRRGTKFVTHFEMNLDERFAPIILDEEVTVSSDEFTASSQVGSQVGSSESSSLIIETPIYPKEPKEPTHSEDFDKSSSFVKRTKVLKAEVIKMELPLEDVGFSIDRKVLNVTAGQYNQLVKIAEDNGLNRVNVEVYMEDLQKLAIENDKIKKPCEFGWVFAAMEKRILARAAELDGLISARKSRSEVKQSAIIDKLEERENTEERLDRYAENRKWLEMNYGADADKVAAFGLNGIRSIVVRNLSVPIIVYDHVGEYCDQVKSTHQYHAQVIDEKKRPRNLTMNPEYPSGVVHEFDFNESSQQLMDKLLPRETMDDMIERRFGDMNRLKAEIKAAEEAKEAAAAKGIEEPPY